MQQAFFVDTRRCIKCYSCEVGCEQWHEIHAGTYLRRWVREECTGTFPDVARRFTSLSCMHCEEPACRDICPVGAISKRPDDGLVTVDASRCVGCRCCALACPFDVPRYTVDRRVMDKCDGCLSLGRRDGEDPRCAATCPTRALHFGPLEEMAALAEAKDGYRMEGPTKPCVYLA